MIRLVVVWARSTELLCGLALGADSGKETGETALLRPSLNELAAGGELVADQLQNAIGKHPFGTVGYPQGLGILGRTASLLAVRDRAALLPGCAFFMVSQIPND